MADTDFDTFAAAHRAEAEKQIELMEQVIHHARAINDRRNEFFAADGAAVTELTALIKQVSAAGLPEKIVKPYRLTALPAPNGRARQPRARTSRTTTPSDAGTPRDDAPTADTSHT